jgi:hypothetical protein
VLTALPKGSCVNREMGSLISYFPMFFYFQRWKERERKREEPVKEKEKTDRN